jgi:hypothetical protein
MIEVQPDPILAARDLGRVGAPLHDRGDDDAVARYPRFRREDEVVADAQAGVGGEARVYCDGAWRILRDATRDGAWRGLAPLRRERAQGKQQQQKSESRSHGVAE